MSRRRKIFFKVLSIAVLLGLIFESWKKEHVAPEGAGGGRTVTFEEMISAPQARYLIGFRGLLDSLEANRPASVPTDFVQSERDKFNLILEQLRGDPKHPEPEAILRKRAVLFSYFRNDTASSAIAERFTKEGSGQVGEILRRELSAPSPTLGIEDETLLKEDLGEYFFTLLRAQALTGESRYNYELTRIVQPATEAAVHFLVLLGLIGIGFVLSFIFFVTLSIRYLSGKLHSRFEVPEIDHHSLLEIFTLYLLSMTGLAGLVKLLTEYAPNSLQQLGPQGTLLVNCTFIVLTLVVLLWPRLSGAPLGGILRTLGLGTESLSRVPGNLFSGLFGYITAWTPAIPFLLFYSIILQIFQINPSQGAHPIIPMMLKEGGEHSFLPIVILAVVIAPIVEEIMFRGALFGYLRAEFGRAPAIFFSALIFALVHPQGPIGVIPLTGIGILLALLREWRGSLLAPMVAHACVNGGTLLLVSTILG